MSDITDLTLLSGLVQETQRETRLLRLQMESVVSRLTTMDQRIATLDQRIATLEQGFHALLAEFGRGQGQMQQQITRVEQRIDGVSSGLSEMHRALDDGINRVIEVLRANATQTPGKI
jgi:TolA-binding protein